MLRNNLTVQLIISNLALAYQILPIFTRFDMLNKQDLFIIYLNTFIVNVPLYIFIISNELCLNRSKYLYAFIAQVLSTVRKITRHIILRHLFFLSSIHTRQRSSMNFIEIFLTLYKII